MVKYTIKRILLIPPMLLVIALLIFFFLNLSRADAVAQMLPEGFTFEDYNRLEHELGLDRPLIVQYADWVWKAVSKGDFGNSYMTKSPVFDEILTRLPVTATLATASTIITILVGIPLGVLCAVKQYSWVDDTLNVVGKTISAIPSFLLAVIFMLVFAMKLRWFPVYGIGTFKHWILPIITQATPFCFTYMRLVRSSMLDCIRKDYIRTARSKGCDERTVIYRDALRNGLLPIITTTGQLYAIMIGGAVVIENVFAVPGLGTNLVAAINSKDIPMVMASAVMLAVITSLMMLVIDLCYAIADPRIKATFISSQRKKEVKVKKSEEAA